MNLKVLQTQANELREKMIKTAEEKQNLLDHEVIAISQELDQILLALQRRKLDRVHTFLLR